MKITPQTYQQMAKEASPPTKSWVTIPSAFLIGGGICTLGELFLNLFTALGADKEAAGAWASICLIFLSALFTGLGLYEKLAKIAGAGTLVPITGFANAMVSPAMEFKQEGLVTGTAVKLFTVAGPVLVYGISASVIYGLILWIMKVV